MKIRTNICILVLLISGFVTVHAQTTQVAVVDSAAVVEPNLKFGLGFGLNFVGGTNISLAPNLVYFLSDRVNIGAGLQGSYTAIKDVQKTTTLGGNLIFQYQPARRFTTLAELVLLNVDTKFETDNTEENFLDTAIFLGAGVNITDKILVGAKVNLLYDEDESVYTSPVLPFVNIVF